MKAVVILALAALMAASAPAEARKKSLAPRMYVHAPRAHKPRAPKSTYKTVRIRQADGTVMTGYRDSTGTHLRGPDGKTIHCQRQPFGADIDVACR